MAEGASCPSLETDEDLVYCSVCMEEFEDPRALPCLHTFCYKCLVQLNRGKGKDTVDLSDIDLQLTALEGELGLPVSTPQKKQNILKCPLCAEEHPIPETKGIDGFRKDFRIKTLVDQHKIKSIDLTSKTFEQSQKLKESITVEEHPEVLSEKCLYHPKENLLYHCESQTCQYDICKECWGSKHDRHVVKLLSMKVNGAKDALLQEMENNIFQVSSQIDVLSETQDNTSAQDEEILQEMKQKYSEMQEQLQNAYEQTIQQFNMHKMLQEKKISDELQNLIALQETFIQIKNSVDKENLPPTSRVFMKYEGMQDKIQELTENIANWSFSYTEAELPVDDSSKEFPIPVSVAYEETSIDQMVEDEEEYDEDYIEDYDEDDYENEDYEDDEYADEVKAVYYDEEETNEYYEDEDYTEEEGYDDEYNEEDNENVPAESKNEEDTDDISNRCSLHPDQKLIYHCGTCKSDVCQECWSCSHENHVVKLMSMKFEDDNVAPPQESSNQSFPPVRYQPAIPRQSSLENKYQPFQAAVPTNLSASVPLNYGQPFVPRPRPSIFPTPQLLCSAPVSTTYNQFIRYPTPPVRIRFLRRPAGKNFSHILKYLLDGVKLSCQLRKLQKCSKQ